MNCDDNCFDVTLPEETKPLHLIPVKFTAGEAGQISQRIEIETDLGKGAAGGILATATVRDAE